MATIPLTHGLDKTEAIEVIRCFWSASIGSIDPPYREYLDYYDSERESLARGFKEEENEFSLMAAQSHEAVRNVVNALSLHRTQPLGRVLKEVKKLFPGSEEDSVRRTINFSLRIWLFLNLGTTVQSTSLGPPKGSVSRPLHEWKDSKESVVDTIDSMFIKSSKQLPWPDNCIESSLTARNLDRYRGLSVEWTMSISEHLSVNLDRNVIYLFPLKACLRSHLDGSGRVSHTSKFSTSILPRRLLEETIWSLNLLFPREREDTEKFLSDHSANIRSALLAPPFEAANSVMDKFDLNQYQYWQQRLRVLNQIYRAEQRSLRYQLVDKRNPLQLYTFWTAFIIFVLTIIFGIISSVTAVIQTRAALKALDIATQALKLQASQGSQQ